MQIFGHFYQFVWADLWTLGQNRGQILLPIVSGKVENIDMPTSKPEKKEPKKPLSVTHPELAKEAVGWDPNKVTAGNSASRLWRCEFGHEWKTSCGNRTISKSNCPVCAGQKAWTGFNDLATTHPDLAKEAHGWDPTKIIAGSNRKLEWICTVGHVWIAVGYSRISGSGCPYCTNQKVLAGFNDLATKFPSIAAEAVDWNPALYVSGTRLKMKWKCAFGHEWKAAIADRTGKDKNGCPFCSNKKLLAGFNDLATLHPKISGEAINWNPNLVMAGNNTIKEWQCALGHKWKASIIQRSRLDTGCPICLNHIVLKGFNDLHTTHLQLSLEADGWDTTKFVAGSGKKMKWICQLSHKWTASINSRVNGSGCPICSGKYVLTGFNDLFTTHPQLAKEAHEWNPMNFSKGSDKKVAWKCEEGHIWVRTISGRVSGTSCPTCAISGFDPNSEAWLYFLNHSQWEMLQIGITNVPDQRLNSHRKLGWEVLEMRGPMDGHLARQWESAILRMLKAKGADLSNEKIAGKFDGYSEAWSKSTFEIKTISELMQLTDEWENIV
jgi:hypothetical protein